MRTTVLWGSRRFRVTVAVLSGALALLLGVVLVAWTSPGPRPVTVATIPSPSPVPSPSPSPSPVPPPPPAPPPDPIPTSSVVADALNSSVAVYATPTVGPVVTKVAARNIIGQPEAFLVVAQVPGWLQVELPIKPNGSTGWIQASAVKLRDVNQFIRVYQSQFRLEYYVGGQLSQTFSVAVGAPSTPTPNGSFFVWASQDVPSAPYTPGIFALSSFSPVLDNWPGGGRTGIHGWTDTSIIGTRASHGCVRMRPADFAKLLHAVPLGTPVEIET